MQIEPAKCQRVGDFVTHHQKIFATQNCRLGFFPAFACQLCRAFQILALPTEAVAQTFYRNADLFKHAVFAKSRRGHLHELKNLDGLAAPGGTQSQAKRCGALALAVSGVDNQNAPALAFG